MPLTRNNHDQPRSPLPGRPFLPPSHYAAAAGIVYDKNKRRIDDANSKFKRAFIDTYPRHPEESESQSSFEFKPKMSVEDRSRVLSQTTGRGRRTRRESLLDDLPQLEANLLPSLRDTIGRMTKSPAQHDPSNASYLRIPRNTSRSSRSLSPSYASREQPTTKSVTPDPSVKGLSAAAGVLASRTNTPTKSSKSNLRQPAMKLSTPIASESPPGTLRGILKKLPSQVENPVIEAGFYRRSTINDASKSTAPSLRSRSRTDPGIVPIIVTTADRAPSRAADNMETQPTPRPKPSAIPRLQPRRTEANPSWSTDESEDIDAHFGPRGRSRQLFISRAKSGSESESDTSRPARTVSKRSAHKGSQLVGLGLGLDSDKRKGQSKGAHSARVPSPSTTSFRTTRRFIRDPSIVQSNNAALDTFTEQTQRREALLDIVSNLKLDSNATETESEYDGQDGVAVSDDSTLHEETHLQIAQDSDVDLDYNEQETKRVGSPFLQAPSLRKSRPRSVSTPTPSFHLSPNPDGISNIQPYSASINKRYLGSSITPQVSGLPQSQASCSSSSRSPIIPQPDAPDIPAALRRHSVYHRPPRPNPSPGVPLRVNDSNDDEIKRLLKERRRLSSGAKPRRTASTPQHIEDVGGVNVRAQAKIDSNRMDIPVETAHCDPIGPSENREEEDHIAFPHTDSDLSSVGSMYWGDDSDSELSPAAKTLFRKLGEPRSGRRSTSERISRSSIVLRTPSPSSPVQLMDNLRQARSASRQEERQPRSSVTRTPSPLPIEPSNDLPVDGIEILRQDIIIEIHQGEETFVKRLQVFIQLFIQPLRVQDSKEWIAGVPAEVARLFDWLEDIVVLHTQILASLESTRDAQYPTVERIAESIRAYIPRLEVYQPYLVNLECVIGLVEDLLERKDNDFAEFVHLQEADPECEGWNFQTFLIEPVNILARFPSLFNRLLELTPRNHRDHMPTLALVRSTEMFIRVMTEVKLREDEYDAIQGYAARIHGLPSSSRLPTRERRLLHQGILHLINVEANDPAGAAGTSSLIRYFPPDANATSVNRLGLGSTNLQPETASRKKFGLGSTSSTSTSTGGSLSSLKASSSTASSVFFSSFKMALPKGRLKASTKKRPPSPSPAPRGLVSTSSAPTSNSRGTPVQAFIFTDILVLAAIDSGSETDQTWTLLNHIGTTRILDVHQPQETDSNDHAHGPQTNDSSMVTVEVFSVDNQQLNQTLHCDLDNISIFSLYLKLPFTQVDNVDAEGQDDLVITQHKWLSALRRCQRSTSCALATPTRNHDPQFDAAIDKQQAVSALLASGLPLPRSPSVQMRSSRGGEEKDGMTLERQERGWWSLRFQQVFRELQRQDLVAAALSLDV